MKIDVLYQFNEKYAPFAGVSMTSLFENNKHFDEIRVFILGEEIEECSKNKLVQLARQYQREILFLSIDPLIEMMKQWNMPTYRGSYAANARLFLNEIVPEDVDKLLYLDADTIVAGKLNELFEMEMGDYPIAMALDSLVRKHKLRLGYQNQSYYFNSGVIVFQMRNWKKGKYSEKIANHVKTIRAHYPSPDQDLLNIVCRNRIKLLKPQFNLQPIHLAFSLADYFRWFCRTGYYQVEEIREAKEKPIIFHFFRFVGEFPWNKDNVHPDKELFDCYLKISPWRDFEKAPTDNNLIFRIEKEMYKRIPRSLFIVFFKVAYEFFIWKSNKDSLKKKINKIM
ncbi:MAG: glycosyltransferase family 8 protein [Lachnospiraceae bacterium]|nr:glycosyltransferase family 8 protein [Lachnospiraceae bacterium]